MFIIAMTNQLAHITDQIFTHPLEVSNSAAYANVEVLKMHRDMKDVVLTSEDYEVNLLVDKIRLSEANVYVALDTIDYYILGEEGRQLQQEARKLLDEWKSIRTEVIEHVRADEYDLAIDITKGRGADHVQRLERKLLDLNQYAIKRAEEFKNESISLENRNQIFASVGTLVVFMIIVLMILWLSFNVLGGIYQLGNSMEDIMNSGEFKDIELEGNDELVSLSQIFNQLIQSLGTQLWVGEGIEKLNNILTQNNPNIDKLKTYIETLLKYNSYLSVAYYDMSKDGLDLKASVNRLGFMESHYAIGEHIIGECALEREEKQIVYGIEEHMDVNESFPFHTVLVKPVIYDDMLYGVVELVLLRQSKQEELVVLDEALFNLGMYMASKSQMGRIDKLLEESIKNNEILTSRQIKLEEQTKELEETNKALEVQKDLLNMKSLELEDQNNELEKLREELLTKYKDLEELSNYRSQFLTNISHELKTPPLNSIILLSSVLEGKERSSFTMEDKEQIGVINKAGGTELLSIINDILDLSKVESGKVSVDEEIFETSDIVAEIKLLYQPSIKDKGLKSRFEDHLHTKLYADKNKILHVITNFVSNAIKFTSSGSITINFKKNDDDQYPLRIDVKDTGIGIEDEKKFMLYSMSLFNPMVPLVGFMVVLD